LNFCASPSTREFACHFLSKLRRKYLVLFLLPWSIGHAECIPLMECLENNGLAPRFLQLLVQLDGLWEL
jgi:hypothetical protein